MIIFCLIFQGVTFLLHLVSLLPQFDYFFILALQLLLNFALQWLVRACVVVFRNRLAQSIWIFPHLCQLCLFLIAKLRILFVILSLYFLDCGLSFLLSFAQDFIISTLQVLFPVSLNNFLLDIGVFLTILFCHCYLKFNVILIISQIKLNSMYILNILY